MRNSIEGQDGQAARSSGAGRMKLSGGGQLVDGKAATPERRLMGGWKKELQDEDKIDVPSP
ncbi:hypothetical protein MKX07_006021 [Trichoderma sp. CBMAI-0711]|nr:hypothetical protein MKX07_006021 [Trichoderma sp. CBMAI-0711]